MLFSSCWQSSSLSLYLKILIIYLAQYTPNIIILICSRIKIIRRCSTFYLTLSLSFSYYVLEVECAFYTYSISPLSPATFQGLTSHLWLVPTELDSTLYLAHSPSFVPDCGKHSTPLDTGVKGRNEPIESWPVSQKPISFLNQPAQWTEQGL